MTTISFTRRKYFEYGNSVRFIKNPIRSHDGIGSIHPLKAEGYKLIQAQGMIVPLIIKKLARG